MFMILAGLAAAPGAALAGETAPPEPMAIVAAVYASLDLELDPQRNAGCQWEAGLKKPRLKDYMAFLTGTLAASEPSDRQTIVARCRAYDPETAVLEKPKTLEAWDCELSFSTVDKAGESPWSYGLRFLLPKGAKRLDPKHLSCPGSP